MKVQVRDNQLASRSPMFHVEVEIDAQDLKGITEGHLVMSVSHPNCPSSQVLLREGLVNSSRGEKKKALVRAVKTEGDGVGVYVFEGLVVPCKQQEDDDIRRQMKRERTSFVVQVALLVVEKVAQTGEDQPQQQQQGLRLVQRDAVLVQDVTICSQFRRVRDTVPFTPVAAVTDASAPEPAVTHDPPPRSFSTTTTTNPLEGVILSGSVPDTKHYDDVFASNFCGQDIVTGVEYSAASALIKTLAWYFEQEGAAAVDSEDILSYAVLSGNRSTIFLAYVYHKVKCGEMKETALQMLLHFIRTCDFAKNLTLLEDAFEIVKTHSTGFEPAQFFSHMKTHVAELHADLQEKMDDYRDLCNSIRTPRMQDQGMNAGNTGSAPPVGGAKTENGVLDLTTVKDVVKEISKSRDTPAVKIPTAELLMPYLRDSHIQNRPRTTIVQCSTIDLCGNEAGAPDAAAPPLQQGQPHPQQDQPHLQQDQSHPPQDQAHPQPRQQPPPPSPPQGKKEEERFSFKVVRELIEERELANQAVIQDLGDKKTFYARGYSMAGKTTFFVAACGVPLVEVKGKWEVEGELPPELAHLKIGTKLGKSCTKHISATVHEEKVFVDGPGHGDTSGPMVDIANVVALKSFFAKLPSLVPMLFIDYPLLNVTHGTMVRKLVQGFCALFSNDTDLLEQHMIVVWTKVPDEVTLDDIQMSVRDLSEPQVADNTPEVINILMAIADGIENTKKRRTTRTMCDRVLLFRPGDDKSARATQTAFRTTKPLPNPGEHFVVCLSGDTKSALDNALNQARADAPIMLQNGETKGVAELLLALKQLSNTIPVIDTTLNNCAKVLHNFVEAQVVSAKEHFEGQVAEGVAVNPALLKIYIAARNLLVSIADLRPFMESLETVDAFDSYTLRKFNQLAEATTNHDSFVIIGANLGKLRDMSESFAYLPGFSDLLAQLTKWVEDKVRAQKNVVDNLQLRPDEVEVVLKSLQELRAAGEQVQRFVSIDCKQLVQNTVTNINSTLGSIYKSLVAMLQSPPPSMDRAHVTNFQTLKAVSNCRDLVSFLEANTPTPTEGEVVSPKKLYQQIEQMSIESARAKLEDLKIVAQGKTALDSSSEGLILPVKAIGELDTLVMQQTEMELARALLCFNSAIDDVIERLQQVLYSSAGLSYQEVPFLLRQLDSSAWLDKYFFTNRIAQKKKEALEHINTSLKSLSNKIKYEYKRGRYDTAEALYAVLDEKLGEHLENSLLEYAELKDATIDFLKQELEGCLAKGEDKQGASVAFSLPEGDIFLGGLAQIASLCKAVGLENRHKEVTRKVKTYLKKVCDDMVNSIASDSEYNFNKYRDVLDCLDGVRSKEEFPNLDDIAGRYDKARQLCRSKVEHITGSLEDTNVTDAAVQLRRLESAVVLNFHLLPDVDILQIIKLNKASKFKALQDTTKEIEDYCRSYNFTHALDLLNSLPTAERTRSLQFLQSFFTNMPIRIKHSISFYCVFGSDSRAENIRSFDNLSKEISNFEMGKNLLGPNLQGQWGVDFDRNIQEMYELLDDKFRGEIATLVKREGDMGFQKVEERLTHIEQLASSLDKKRMPKTFAGLAEVFAKHEAHWNIACGMLENLQENIEAIDSTCESWCKHSHPDAERYLKEVKRSISSMAHQQASLATLADAKAKLNQLNRLYHRISFTPLKNFAAEQRAELAEKIDTTFGAKVEQFGKYLVDWDLPHIRGFFVEFANDADVIKNLSSKLHDAAVRLISRTDALLASKDLQSLKTNLGVITTVYYDTTFRAVIDAQSMKDLVGSMRRFAEEQVKLLIKHLSGKSALRSQGGVISASLAIILDLKSLEDMVKDQDPIVPDSLFADLIDQISKLFGSNATNLAASLARRDFRLMAETFECIQLCDTPQRTLKSFLEKSTHPSMAPLRTIISNCLDMTQSILMVEGFLETLDDCVEELWVRQEFAGILKLIQGAQSGSAKQVVHLFPQIEERLNSVVASITRKYEQLGRHTENCFWNEKWKEFREGLAALEGMSEVEAVLGGRVRMQLRASIADKIKSIKEGTPLNRESIAGSLVDLNKLSQNIPQFADVIQQTSTDLITTYAGTNMDEVYKLGMVLDKMEGPHGREVVASFKVFSRVNMEAWTKKTAGQDIGWALGEENGVPRFVYSDSFDNTPQSSSKLAWAFDKFVSYCKPRTSDRDTWLAWYGTFEGEFYTLYDECLLHGLEPVVEETQEYIRRKKPLPSILARICVVWSILKTGAMRSQGQQQQQQQVFRLAPHPVQVLCFFRLLGPSPRGTFYNQLIEILTGEGKSIVLGIVATYFALLGYDVYSICYSEYLSARDFKDFEEVFDAFGVKSKITYSTIAEMCEKIINKKGNVRDLAKHVIENASKVSACAPPKQAPPAVLLIDEVDVFFGKDFYGSTYNPATLISNDATYELLNFIYRYRGGGGAQCDMSTVSKTKSYLDLVQMYPKLKPLIDHEIRKMLKDVKDFENTPERPILNNGIIFYKDQDVITCKKVYGYKTAFQYFHKFIQGEITDLQTVREHVGIYLGCGNFSFAEIPKAFMYKMGVSGTLRSLTPEEKEVVQSYGIERLAFAPSIYGGSRLNEKEAIPKMSAITLVQTKDNYFLRITNLAQEKRRAGRAVLVFFESIEALQEFVAAKGKDLGNFQVLEEKEKFKETVIKQATESEALTLCTRPFGRGVDFICRDPRTESSGGVHVIQCFVASSEAEQIQIKGRAARQGQAGSHEFVLFHGDLIKYLGTKEGQPAEYGFNKWEVDSVLPLAALHEKISTLRDELYCAEVRELSAKKDDALKAHTSTVHFHEKLIKYNGTPESIADITDSILKINQAALSQAVAKYHLFFCLDESGSMSGEPWSSLMAAVGAFITKRIELCNANNCIAEDLVTVVNYASAARVVLQSKPITSSPQQSINFKGGGTDFAAGLSTILPCIKATGAGFTPCLIFMSDGGSSNGEAEMENIRTQCPNVKVFVVGFGSSCDRNKLGKLATLGGGTFLFGVDGTQLKSEFEVISTKISGGVMAL